VTALDSGAAFFGLLDLSERRLTAIEHLRTRLRWLRGLWAGLALVALLVPFGVLTGVRDSGPASTGWLVGAAVAAVGVFALWLFVLRPADLRLAADERRMVADVNRLREVYAHFARREEWEEELIRSVRQRLSAFPIQVRGQR
jgi:hypothetical protein